MTKRPVKNKKYVSKEEALERLKRYCVYQDRCHQEVRNKLKDLGVYGDDLDDIVLALLQDNFLNEERFTRSFVRGKFRFKNWGRRKLTLELKKREISDYCIRKGMEEIEEEDYIQTLNELLEKKKRETQGYTEFETKKKMAEFAIRRGFESELVWSEINRNF
ncbi:MAG: regulatory protein RecX [Saprospiraceae bacterium]